MVLRHQATAFCMSIVTPTSQPVQIRRGVVVWPWYIKMVFKSHHTSTRQFTPLSSFNWSISAILAATLSSPTCIALLPRASQPFLLNSQTSSSRGRCKGKQLPHSCSPPHLSITDQARRSNDFIWDGDRSAGLLQLAAARDIKRQHRETAVRPEQSCSSCLPCSLEDALQTLLCQLHWLPVQQRVTYKIGLLVYKTLQSEKPALFALLTDSLRTSSMIAIEGTFLVDQGLFQHESSLASIQAFRLWNLERLNLNTRCAASLGTFEKLLKTELFTSVFRV